MGYNKDYLKLVNNTWQYYRRVPKDVAHLDTRTFAKTSLKTDSQAEARKKAAIVNQETEHYWQNLRDGASKDAAERYEAAVKIARSRGFTYSPMKELAEGNVANIVRRLEAIDNQNSTDNRVEVAALLGTVDKPSLLLSAALEKFWDLQKDTTRKKNEREYRRWQNPRKKAVRNFIEVIGDKSIGDITRNDALDFRDWWQNRIIEEELNGNTANKDIGHLKTIFQALNDFMRLGLTNPFPGLHFSERNDGEERLPFDPEYVQSVLLNRENLSGMDEECQMMLFAMASTGCGFNEITGLDGKAGEIVLDAKIPYIDIKPNNHRSLKTSAHKKDYRQRHIPLAGSALHAFKKYPEGFTRYQGKQDTASTTINKYLRKNGLFPSEQHSAYSLRHTFEDRLTAVEAPDKVAAALMGHKFHRPKYGSGPSLELKHKWIKKVAFKA